jgi:hypothetical protein
MLSLAIELQVGAEYLQRIHCALQRAASNTLATCTMHHATSNTPATCTMRHTTHSIQHATYNVQHATCNTPASCQRSHTPCTMHHANGTDSLATAEQAMGGHSTPPEGHSTPHCLLPSSGDLRRTARRRPVSFRCVGDRPARRAAEGFDARAPEGADRTESSTAE